MAVMHPVDIENYDYTPTEKEMYFALKEQLPENIKSSTLFVGLRRLMTKELTAKAIF